MGIKIETLGVVVTGAVTRKFDGQNTTLTLTGEQAKALYDSLGPVLAFLDGPAPLMGTLAHAKHQAQATVAAMAENVVPTNGTDDVAPHKVPDS